MMNYWTQSKKNIYVAAHRGDSTSFPENTIEAFKAALEANVDQIETDVRCTKDGVLVLIHDETVDRTTNGTGKVSSFTLKQIKSLDAGSFKGEQFKGLKVPTLEELMELIKDHPTITLDIELKVYPTEGNEQYAYKVCDMTLEMIENYGFSERIVINSFHSGLHEYIQNKYGNKYKHHVYFPIERNKEYTIDPYSYAYCCCMFKEQDGEPMASVKAFEEMEKRSVQPWAGASVKDENTVDIAIERGAQLITCNNPDEILKILRTKGYHK